MTFNNYFLGIPLVLNYKIWDFDKLKVQFIIGFCGEILLEQKNSYEMIKSNYTYKNTLVTKFKNYQDNLNISTLAGFDFNYPINDKFGLFIQPNYEIMIYKNGSDFSGSRFWDLGTKIGINYRI